MYFYSYIFCKQFTLAQYIFIYILANIVFCKYTFCMYVFVRLHYKIHKIAGIKGKKISSHMSFKTRLNMFILQFRPKPTCSLFLRRGKKYLNQHYAVVDWLRCLYQFVILTWNDAKPVKVLRFFFKKMYLYTLIHGIIYTWFHL